MYWYVFFAKVKDFDYLNIEYSVYEFNDIDKKNDFIDNLSHYYDTKNKIYYDKDFWPIEDEEYIIEVDYTYYIHKSEQKIEEENYKNIFEEQINIIENKFEDIFKREEEYKNIMLLDDQNEKDKRLGRYMSDIKYIVAGMIALDIRQDWKDMESVTYRLNVIEDLMNSSIEDLYNCSYGDVYCDGRELRDSKKGGPYGYNIFTKKELDRLNLNYNIFEDDDEKGNKYILNNMCIGYTKWLIS